MSELQVESRPESDPDCVVVTLKGNLDLFTFGDLKAVFEKVDNGRIGLRLAVDLSGVAYVASSGWGVLMSRAKQLKNRGGGLVVFGLNDGNSKVYETLHVESLMPSADDLRQAKDRLRPRADEPG